MSEIACRDDPARVRCGHVSHASFRVPCCSPGRGVEELDYEEFTEVVLRLAVYFMPG